MSHLLTRVIHASVKSFKTHLVNIDFVQTMCDSLVQTFVDLHVDTTLPGVLKSRAPRDRYQRWQRLKEVSF